jgi:flagellar biosynthesis/type III secretory pathway protein FliH
MASLQTRRDERKRFLAREELLKGLFATNISEAKVRDVTTFYEWVLQLSPELEKEFRSVEERVEGAMGKPFITAREREAIEKGVHQGVQQGMQQGMQQGTAEMVKEALEERLNGSSGRFVDKVMLYSPADLKLLLRLLMKTSNAEEIENWFKTHPPSKNSANN